MIAITDVLFSPQVVLKEFIPIEKTNIFQVDTALSAKLREMEGELKEAKRRCTKLEGDVLRLKFVVSIPMMSLPNLNA